ncbi:helix-turn-helix transcriptional regulator [Acidaminobacter sp. JC074]|uniref:winged helix-turn-helix transcriptional regulator n=1 Tax=Acidaminobacter sp. JC074 TaxID=2530199 RepID=UPI001F0E7E9A|nr:helix-turn-helix domain-containing protein [Acidaminobacter sp. JC074]MCH4889121.1 helix-turn-helix transcriptional regulator [Acidaminobacter sp. JC074]
MLKYKNKEYICHLDFAMEFIRSKWKAVILCHLIDGSKRFLELQRYLPGISHKVLNDNLKQLQEDGLIKKEVFPEVPPRVEFSLTDKGQELVPALNTLEKWGIKYFPENIDELSRK